MALPFTESTYHTLMSHGSTTVQTVPDSDGVLKNALHNQVTSTVLSDWGQVRLDSVVESGVSPSGKPAYLVTESTDSSGHYVYLSTSFTSGHYMKMSFEFKGNGRDGIAIQAPSSAFGADVNWEFDYVNMTATQAAGGTKDAGFISSLGNDWYRADLYAQATSTGTGSLVAFLLSSSGVSYVGDGSSGVYLSRPRVMKASVHAPVERIGVSQFDTIPAGCTDNADGTYTWDGTQGANSNLVETVGGSSYTVGDTFRMEITVSGYSAGNINRISFCGTTTAVTYGADGTYVLTGVVISDSGNNVIRAGSTFTGTVSASLTKVITNGVQADSDGEDFMATDGAAVYSDGVAYDGNGACLGLQAFEARTNLITESHDLSTWNVWSGGLTVTDNDAVGPDGDLSMSKLARVDANSNGIREQLTLAASTTYVYAAFWQAGDAARSEMLIWDINASASVARLKFDWTAGVPSTQLDTGASNVKYEDWGGGLYRISFTFTTAATVTDHNVILSPETNGSGTEYAYAGLADVSEGASVAPYIPTNGSTVPRSRTNCYKAVSEFGYRQDEGTVVVTFQSAGSAATSPLAYSLSDGTASNRIESVARTSAHLFTKYSGSTEVNIDAGTYTDDEVSTFAAALKDSDFAVSLDGGAAGTASSGSMPPVSQLNLGVRYDGAGYHLNGYIKKLVYYPARLADATLVEESS